jgi:hypothetical protein
LSAGRDHLAFLDHVHEFNPLEDHPDRTKGPEAAPLVKLPLPLLLDNKEPRWAHCAKQVLMLANVSLWSAIELEDFLNFRGFGLRIPYIVRMSKTRHSPTWATPSIQ